MRAKDRPYAAAPRTWDEVPAGAERDGALTQMLAEDLPDRVDRLGDLAAPLLG
jgi:bifunctional non-homologous end joining protein LigD